MMKKENQDAEKSRRKFFRMLAAGGIGAAVAPMAAGNLLAQEPRPAKTATNVEDALKFPRTENSLPGKFPGKVVEVSHENSMVDNQPSEAAAAEMLHKGMLALTGEDDIRKAWSLFVSPGEIIGLKLNPIGGRLLSSSHAVVKSVIAQLEETGIPRDKIVIFDRRLKQLYEAGFTQENYPGIRIAGTEHVDEKGSWYNENGELYSLERIDKNWFYWADCETDYDDYTLPYMVNKGKYSYFSKIVTEEVDKIINIPIMKNAGGSITLCLKNLGYGVITNTSRLHATLWAETSAEVCAFPPVRDKVVLNIADGLRGCYDGGPGANPQFFTDYKTLLIGTDPVAVDRIGYERIIGKRIEMGRQAGFVPTGLKQMELASALELGVADLDGIDHQLIRLA